MRLLSLSLGLAAVALVAAQADPLSANGPQTTYEWAGESDLENALDIQYDALSEQHFRAVLLTSYQVADFQAEGCESIINDISNTIKTALDAAAAIVSPLPGVGVIVQYVKTALHQLLDIQASAVTSTITVPVALAISTVQAVITSLSITDAGLVPQPVSSIINTMEPLLNSLAACRGGVTGRLEIDVSRCSSLADLYRLTLEDSIKINPASNLPADASEELKRLTTGSLALLDLLSKTSIAKTNDALLAIRPIFAGDLLAEYRAELLRLNPSEDIRNYAEISLGSIVGFSNSLEACLHVAADPVVALEELNEELAAEAEEDEYEDEDEEDDEDDDDD